MEILSVSGKTDADHRAPPGTNELIGPLTMEQPIESEAVGVGRDGTENAGRHALGGAADRL
jgi:hypothetical protein